jgi:hypothetical protein
VKWLWAASVIGEALLALRLVSLGLESRFPWLVAMLWSGVVRSVILLSLVPRTTAYGLTWAFTAPILLALQVAAVLELFRRTCAHYRGIGTFARWLLLASVGIGAFAGLSMAVGVERRPTELALAILVIGQRYVATTLGVAILMFRLFFWYFPAPLRPNVRRHANILTVYLMSIAAAYYAFKPFGDGFGSIFLMGTELVCLAAWGLALSRSGEREPEAPGGLPIDVADERVRRALEGAASVLR